MNLNNMKFTPDAEAEKKIRKQLEQAMKQAAEASAKLLGENLSAGTRSGRKYAKLPRRSSAPDEFIQEQFGDIKRGIGFVPAPQALGYSVGTDGRELDILKDLEFGSADGRIKGRLSLTRTAESGENARVMGEAIEDFGRTQ